MRTANTGHEVGGVTTTVPFQLPLGQQVLWGIGITLLLAASMYLMHSPILLVGIVGAAVVFAVARNGVASLFAFVIINVALTLRSKESMSGGTPSALDLLLGITLAGIIGYWVVRIRIIEGQTLSRSFGQLCMALFAVWAIAVTIGGLFNEHNSFGDALREMLNLAPLLILPMLYSRFIEHNSLAERGIIITVLAAACLMVVWNILRIHNHLLRAVYLYEMGRASADEMLSFLLIFVGVVCFMNRYRLRLSILAVVAFCLGTIGIIISISRTLYLASIFCAMVVLFLGDKNERRRGMGHLALVGIVAVLAFIPLYESSYLARLLFKNYALRFLSAQHLTTDLSLTNRYVEWRDEIHAILQSPLFGHGFGTQFRVFNIIDGGHHWLGFSHSSYLYVMFKTGFVGATLFLSAYFSFLFKGLRLLKSDRLTPKARTIIRIGIAYIVGMLIYAYAAPTFDSKTDLIWLGLFWGYFLSLEKTQMVAVLK